MAAASHGRQMIGGLPRWRSGFNNSKNEIFGSIAACPNVAVSDDDLGLGNSVEFVGIAENDSA